jgi:hypothetical protein
VAKTFDPRINDSDADGDPLTVTAVSTPSHGTATIGTGGTSVTYTATAGYSESDSFTYTISDGHVTATATVAVTVTAPAATYTTLDSAKASPSVSLSNGNLTANGTVSYGYVMSAAGISSGQASFEVTPAGLSGTGAQLWIGIAALPPGGVPGDNGNNWAGGDPTLRMGVYVDGGVWMTTASSGFYNTNQDAWGLAMANGAPIRVEVDRDAGTLTFRQGSFVSHAYLLPAGTLYVAVGFDPNMGARSVTVNLGQQPWAIAPSAPQFNRALGSSAGP